MSFPYPGNDWFCMSNSPYFFICFFSLNFQIQLIILSFGLTTSRLLIVFKAFGAPWKWQSGEKLLFTPSHLTKAIPTWKTRLAVGQSLLPKGGNGLVSSQASGAITLSPPTYYPVQPLLLSALAILVIRICFPVVQASHRQWSIINENNRTMHMKLVKKSLSPQMQAENKEITNLFGLENGIHF